MKSSPWSAFPLIIGLHACQGSSDPNASSDPSAASDPGAASDPSAMGEDATGSDAAGNEEMSTARVEASSDAEGQSDPQAGAQDGGGSPLSMGETEAEEQSSDPEPSISDTVTWHQHIAPLVAQKCGGCHEAGGIAPFSIASFEDAQTWAPLMAAEIEAMTMPPWGARETEECTPPAPFKDDIRLSEQEKQLFARWVENGTPEGNVEAAVPLPPPPKVALEDPSRQLTIPSSVTVEGSSDDFICFTLDPEITDESWLTGTQVVPGNNAIVHHALVYLDREGEGASLADDNGQYRCFGGPGLSRTRLLAAWAPGAVPNVLPDDTGMRLQPGDKLVVQLHYHPTGQGPETDSDTRVDLRWSQQEPDYVGGLFLVGNFDEVDADFAGGAGYGLTTGPDFLIPAGAKDHVEENRYWLDDGGDPLASLVNIYVYAVATHMHYVGTDMKITVSSPTGRERCLVQTPEWDFEWQRAYYYEGEVSSLPTIFPGDSINMRCTYDNSLDNPFVREALDEQGLTEPQDVLLGDETLDEMCLGVFGLAVPKDRAEAFGLR